MTSLHLIPHHEALWVEEDLLADVCRPEAILNRAKCLAAVEEDDRDGQVELSRDGVDDFGLKELAWAPNLYVKPLLEIILPIEMELGFWGLNNYKVALIGLSWRCLVLSGGIYVDQHGCMNHTPSTILLDRLY